ncbi:50S ribosomal protein L13 [Candidatus Woesearchaeota archaeon]|nr:MAG: 50S ribosomal protein L13 [Candidatus Woesearchaeota archaeon]
MIIIDATDMIAGRLATVVAKKALLGEKISIINAEKAILTGNKEWILKRFQQKRNLGAPLIGPYFPKQSDRILKRIIRGMLPYKQAKGRTAFENIKCYVGVPEEFTGKEASKIENASIEKLPNTKFVQIGEISRLIGAKQ